MPSSSPLAPDREPLNGLPPVVPPSGKFIAQLFLVPALIVSVAVLLLLGFSWLAGGARAPDRLLANLKDPNPDVKWRAAHDLAQVLLRDDQLASDPKFALDLAEQMRQALQDNRQSEQRSRTQLPNLDTDAEQAEKRTRERERSSIQYLSASLGNLAIPVGVSLLNEAATRDDGLPPDVATLRHRQALWALANLGQNLKRFDRLPPERQQAVLSGLEEAANASGERGAWAGMALDYLKNPSPRSLQPLGVEATLLKAAGSEDPFSREVVAFALNFWEGTPEENARLETLLTRLCRDDGHGEGSAARPADEQSGDEAVTRQPGLKIRYNAAAALARRGSDKARLDVLDEMLDEPRQLDSFRIKHKDGQETPDEATARTAVVSALQAVAALHEKRPERDLSELVPPIERLAQSSTPALKREAERTLIVLGRK